MLRPHPNIPSVWTLEAPSRADDGPTVGVIGALHGNETAGLRAIERIVAEPSPLLERMRRGKLVLVHGNPRATEQKRRYSRGGADINRLFGYSYVDDLAPEAWTYEHHRALELRPLLESLDALIDLHSASQPTVPFAVSDRAPGAIALARKTGCRVTYGWDGPGMLMEHVSIGMFVAQGKPALSVECGQHDDPDTPKQAEDVLTRFLGALGVTDHDTSAGSGTAYEMFGRVVKPTREFELTREFSSFDRLAPGDVLGAGEGVTISVDREAYLLLPTPKASRGEDIVYLARADS